MREAFQTAPASPLCPLSELGRAANSSSVSVCLSEGEWGQWKDGSCLRGILSHIRQGRCFLFFFCFFLKEEITGRQTLKIEFGKMWSFV